MAKLMGKNIFFFLIFFLLACFITFPLIFNLASITTGYGDELIIAWNHNWDIYNFSFNVQNLLHIFDANTFFPYHNSLAFSDVYFMDSILALIPVILLNSPIVANNFTIIISLTLVGFFTYLLSFSITKEKLISFLAGILVIFSPAYLSELTHIQIIAIYFVILSIIFLINFLQTKKTFYFILFLIFFVFQIYNSFMPGFFIAFSSVLICLFYLLEDKKRAKFLFTKKHIFLLLISIAVILPIIIPYYKVSKEFNYVRDLRETIHFALQPEDFLSTSTFSRLEPLLSQVSFTKDLAGKGEVKPGFIGLTFSILVIVSFFYIIKNWKKQNYIVKGIFAASILGFLLSLGPFMHLGRLTIHNPFPIPLPYLIFYYIVPGFKGIRNSARFEMLFIIMAAPMVAVFLKESLKNIPLNIKYGLILLLAFLAILEFNFPIKYYPLPQIKDFPKVYSWLSTTPKSTVIIEMPIYNWSMAPYSSDEYRREYYSTAHFRKTVNGASGFSPFPWQVMVTNLLATFPSKDSIKELSRIGVNLIIVHKDEYDRLYKKGYTVNDNKILSGDEVINNLLSNDAVISYKTFGKDYVFRIK